LGEKSSSKRISLREMLEQVSLREKTCKP